MCLYWAQALAAQDEDAELKDKFSAFADQLAEAETTIIREINISQGKPTDIGGYYLPDDKLAAQAMRPSATLNTALASLL